MDTVQAYDTIYGALEDEAYDADIKYTVENNGIGAYEYWGAKGYDEGEDYVIIEENSFISIETNWSQRLLKKIADDIVFEDEEIIGKISTDYDDIRITGRVDDYKIDKGVVTFEIVWSN